MKHILGSLLLVLLMLSLFSSRILCFQSAAFVADPGNETDWLALSEFKSLIRNDPYGILRSWNDSVDFCSWNGITCGHKHRRVVSLKLPAQSLSGTISHFIGNLTFLRFLDLSHNSFNGVIPREIGHLFRLRYLYLYNNTLGGDIPVNIGYCSELRVLSLAKNHLAGEIPAELGNLKKLIALNLARNSLTGKIPVAIGNLSFLQRISVGENNLIGNIPDELGRLGNLTFLKLAINYLSGTIPSSIYNISTITVFSMTQNQLTGSLPANIGLTFPNLKEFVVGRNRFHGSIPVSLVNISQLEWFDVSQNNFGGQVPNYLGYLRSLRILNLEVNFLGNKTSRDLNFIAYMSNCTNLEVLSLDQNNFGGLIPRAIGNLSSVIHQLILGGNQISGRIPEEIGNLVNLYTLAVEGNYISGTIPSSFGRLVKLQMLTLFTNMLSGEIPSSLGNITQLYMLYLDENNLEGDINNSSIWNCQNLQFLDISNNHFFGSITKQILGRSVFTALDLSGNRLTGSLPTEIGNLRSVQILYASHNRLSGEIPEAIGDCSSLEMLYLRNNSFQGTIPLSLVSLRGLMSLDLSTNKLSGTIPIDLGKLMFLEYLNLSFNHLAGEVPKNGVFSNASAISLSGNKNLCGGIAELQLPPCPAKQKKHWKFTTPAVLAAVISSIVILATSVFLCFFYLRKSRKNPSSKPFDADKLPLISYNELLRATRGFSSDSIIGEGSFGTVYRGSLDLEGEKLVAVKVLKLQKDGAYKSFLAECKALRNIRHRNLVKILTYCSSIDFKGNDFKALVFDHMENGSLEMWLHPEEDGHSQSKSLTLTQRLHAAVDVSSALHYLHDNCEPPIVHCDLKPSNILFDSDMTAHVGDFGLARLLPNDVQSHSQGETSSLGMKGTIGYMAPEYGFGGQPTTNGDVYSFGIILLEIFTGLRPTDHVFVDGLNIHDYVKAMFPQQVIQVVDPVLVATRESVAGGTSEAIENDHFIIQEDGVAVFSQAEEGILQCIASVLEIALACSAELPANRMNMRDVNRKLNVISETFLCTRNPRARQMVAH